MLKLVLTPNKHQIIPVAHAGAWLQALQCEQPLLITHRLDACTEGLLVVGRTLAFVQHFNKLLQQPGAVRKYYKALTQRPPPLGAVSPACIHSAVQVEPCAGNQEACGRGWGEAGKMWGAWHSPAFVHMHAVAGNQML